MKLPDRTFDTVHAERVAVPLWVALFSPSGGGKTFSALRLAKGIQSVRGGSIHMIDTESGRGLHYADLFDYQYTPLEAPFSSLDYLAAINHVVNEKKARIVIIDSLSHEHESEGGYLEQHEAELDRMAGNDFKKRDSMNMLAWGRPKAARTRLINTMLRMKDVAFILGFRADDSSKPVKGDDGKTKVVHMGFMPIAGRRFIYEATVAALLMPGAGGVPTWEPENVGEKMMRKLPEQFKGLFERTKGQPLSEQHGIALAEWARGGVQAAAGASTNLAAPSPLADRIAKLTSALNAAKTTADVDRAWSRASALVSELRLSDPEKFNALSLLHESRVDELAEAQKELV